MTDDGETWSVISSPDAHHAVLEELEKAGVTPATAEVTQIPQNTVKVAGKQAAAVLRMMEAIEEHDDVQNVYANFDIDDSELERLSA